ncbi:hypothetical protein [Nocardia brasiliensis]|uniref:hypothetical protein n=1 Tax=Nocardia brasiliensis TaxID=37326 RepID=UPI003D941EA0
MSAKNRPLSVEMLADRYEVSITVLRHELTRTHGQLEPLNPGSDVPVFDVVKADQWWAARRLATSRYRSGARDQEARSAHARDTGEWRRALRRAEFGPREHQVVFERLRAGERLSEAAAAAGMTTVGVYGRARWDPDFSTALEAVLAETCPVCAYGDAQKRGHCRECRSAHHPGTGKGPPPMSVFR